MGAGATKASTTEEVVAAAKALAIAARKKLVCRMQVMVNEVWSDNRDRGLLLQLQMNR